VEPRAGDGLVVVDVDVAVQVVAWLEGPEEPAEDLEALVREVFLIVDVACGGVRDQDIQVAPVSGPVEQQLGDHPVNLPPHPRLAELVGAVVVSQRAVKPADQQPLLLHHPTV